MRLRNVSIGVLCCFLLACGGGHLARRGDQQLAQGEYDAAIASYEAAARASAGDPQEAARYRASVASTRKRAARLQINQGDQAYRRNDLKAAGAAYKKARSYAPTDPLVVDRLSTLLKTRVRIESQLDAAWKELTAVQGADAKGSLERWDALIATAESLLDWRKDYPRTQALWNAVAAPASVVMVDAARTALAAKDFSGARRRAERALRLSPNDADAKTLLDQIDRSGSASAHAADAALALKEGRLVDALEAYHLALAQNPNSAAATAGQRTARDAYVTARLSDAKLLGKKRNNLGELLALRDAWTVNTDNKALAKKLLLQYDRVHKRAITAFYHAGRKHEKGRRHGAALIAYRTAEALGGGPKDLGSRIEACVKASASGQTYRLSLTLKRPPKDVLTMGSHAALVALRKAVATAKLDAVGVQITEDSRAARGAEGSLVLEVPRFALPHQDRAEPRKKKFLDRVEFPANPAWAEAQARQSAALTELNGATDRLRPLQDEVNALEGRLASLDEKLIKLKADILKEDAIYYAREPTPCPDKTTNCPQSYANRRWAKHLTWHNDQIAKTNAKIAKLSPDFSAARDAVGKAQEAFDQAERQARETPAKLRKEIWKNHAYTVMLHIVDLKGSVQLRWADKLAKAELAAGEAKMDTQQVDFSTPGVVVKQQTLEPPRKSTVPDDSALAAQMAETLITAVSAAVWPRLRLHGERFALRAKRERRGAFRLDLQVRALATGAALPAESRKQFEIEVLKATGYNWTSMSVDLALIPYR